MGNTVGNSNAEFCNFYSNPLHAYILGLWCSDGYHRTSSIGLSNVNPRLIQEFVNFLRNFFPPERLRLKVYRNSRISSEMVGFGIANIRTLYSAKARQIAYQAYVNSRPLLAEFNKAKLS